MVVPASTDFAQALTDPLAIVQDEFVRSGKDESAFTRNVHDRFAALFHDDEARCKVPFLTSSQSKAIDDQNSRPKLVRWRCMIQDTSLGNEVLPRQLRTQNDGLAQNGLFGAASTITASATDVPSEGGFGSLTTLCGVTIPAQTAWAKRLDEGRIESASADEPGTVKSASTSTTLLDKLPRQEGFACLLKVYDEDLAESMQVAQIVDVLGIVDQTALPSADWTQMGGSASAEEASTPQLHTTIHVISFNKSAAQTLPLSSSSSNTVDADARQAIIDLLARTALGGDILAAEWTLLSLIARTHTRSASHTLGALSVNISGFPARVNVDQTPALKHILQNIVPLLADQSLDLSHLNAASTRFLPKSEADERGLRAGRLQLAPNTLLFIDETTMNEGQLKDNGIANIRGLSDVLTTHKLTYAFPFSSHDMDVDLSCIVVSQGKSFLPIDVQLPLAHDAAAKVDGLYITSTNYSPSLNEDSVWVVRRYLANIVQRTCRANAFTIPANVSDRIQDDFVQTRKANQTQALGTTEGVVPGAGRPSTGEAPLGAPGAPTSTPVLMETQEDLNRIIQVARLLCLSKGHDVLRWDDWQEAKRLDVERQARLTGV